MKKIISILIAVFMLTALCACGGGKDTEEATVYSVGEMKFTLDSNFTLDKKSVEEKASYTENEVYASENFTGNHFDLTVSAVLTSYDNSSIDKYIDEMLDITVTSKDFQAMKFGDIAGKIGSYDIDNSEMYAAYALKDGFFYSFEAKVKSNDESVAEALRTICQTVIYDPALVETQTVTCGDLTYEIPKKYAALEFDEVMTSYDERWFATANDSYIEFGSLYFIDWENGYDLSSMAYTLTTELENAVQTSEEGSLGTYEYITGKDAAGYNHIIAMFKYVDKSYCFNLFSKNEMTVNDIKPIIDSIKATAPANGTDMTDAMDVTDETLITE